MAQTRTVHVPLLNPAAWECVSRRCGLSARERQIAVGVLEDQKESTIARRLGISTHTVHTHLERMYRKLDVSSRVQLVVRLAECRLALTVEPGSTLAPLCGNRSAGKCPLAS